MLTHECQEMGATTEPLLHPDAWRGPRASRFHKRLGSESGSCQLPNFKFLSCYRMMLTKASNSKKIPSKSLIKRRPHNRERWPHPQCQTQQYWALPCMLPSGTAPRSTATRGSVSCKPKHNCSQIHSTSVMFPLPKSPGAVSWEP